MFSVLSLARGSTAFLSIPGVLNYVGVASQVGIIATSVALLMIAGEFDLSVGSLVGFAGIIIGIGSTIWGLPIWLAILISMALTTGLGVLNGLIVVRTGLPSFIVTLATMFIIAGLSSVLVLGLTNITFIPIEPTLIAADPLAQFFNWKFSVKFDLATSDLYVSVVWWIVIAVVGAYVLSRPQVRQLDRRRRRLAERGPQPRCPRRAREGHPLRGRPPSRRRSWPPARACSSRPPTSSAAPATS